MQVSVSQALEKLSQSGLNGTFVEVIRNGTMSVELFKPDQIDTQTPHEQDELYVVISGTGEFLNEGKRSPFGPGDVLFVRAGIEHHFENFTDDFMVWVIFYGPVGGDTPAETII